VPSEPLETAWREAIYDPDTNRARHEIQQRYWRRARGEETEADLWAEHLAERIRRRENAGEIGQRYEDLGAPLPLVVRATIAPSRKIRLPMWSMSARSRSVAGATRT
jgi:hypothetical protein